MNKNSRAHVSRIVDLFQASGKRRLFVRTGSRDRLSRKIVIPRSSIANRSIDRSLSGEEDLELQAGALLHSVTVLNTVHTGINNYGHVRR